MPEFDGLPGLRIPYLIARQRLFGGDQSIFRSANSFNTNLGTDLNKMTVRVSNDP
jgi:hypothetical protein